jgi:hemoglobin-like flavoprotein
MQSRQRGAQLLQRVGPAAERREGYGGRDEHYQLVGAALLKTLAQGLADDFTPAVRDAWTQVYGVVSGAMIAAARGAGDRPAA